MVWWVIQYTRAPSSYYCARVIALAGLRKRFDETTTIGPIDLEIRDGARIALLGPSGGGKSSVLRMLIGLTPPDSGAVLRDGHPLDRAGFAALRRTVGYLTQDGALWPHRTARGNVELWPRELGWPADRIAARTSTLCEMVRLPSALLDRYPFSLSGGQRQRVALMRALFLGPSLLLLDEPLAALDPITRLELQDELATLIATLSATSVLVTHDLREATKLAAEVVLLRDGRIVQRGTMAELASNPSEPFVSRFLAAQGYQGEVAR